MLLLQQAHSYKGRASPEHLMGLLKMSESLSDAYISAFLETMKTLDRRGAQSSSHTVTP